jgi:hypothetical protein
MGVPEGRSGPRTLEQTAARVAERWTSTEQFPRTSEAEASSGRLPSAVRSFTEPRLGVDLSSVRIHVDEPAARLSRAQNAEAFTDGDDIYFGAGLYAPGSVVGRQLIAHELVHVGQQRLSEPGSVPKLQHAKASPNPRQVKEKYRTIFFPDYAGLASNLLGRLPDDSRFVNDLFNLLSDGDQTVLSSTIAFQATDSQLRRIAAHRGGRAVLWRMVAAMRTLSSISTFERDQERVLFAASPEHKRMKEEPWLKSPKVKAALKHSAAEVQSISSGWASGQPQFDEYAVTIDAMPPGLTPEAFLAQMSRDINKAVRDYWFDAINEFKRTKTKRPVAVGDIYHIDIAGPDNGSVMLVESAPDHFIFQIVATAQDGTHPEYGSREFGFERNADGSVRFYTRGASRSGMLPGTTLFGRPLQKVGWTHLVTGIGNRLAKRGGKVRPGSIRTWWTQD